MSNSIRGKQNQPRVGQVRLSLKMGQTPNKRPQKLQGRMSMLPLKRQRKSLPVQNNLPEPRLSGLRNSTLILNYTTQNASSFQNACQKSIRKQTIINNLVNKLDQEQQIRSIIEAKLRTNTYGLNKQFMYASEFNPSTTNKPNNLSLYKSNKNLALVLRDINEKSTEDTHHNQNNTDNAILSSQLRKCQQSIKYFKSIVNQMAEKIKSMENNVNGNNFKQNCLNQTLENDSLKCASCKLCNSTQKKRNDKSNFKKSRDAVIQTSPQKLKKSIIQPKQRQNHESYQLDFFKNLEKTLEILNINKQF